MNSRSELMWYCRLWAWCVPVIADFSFLCDILRHRPAPNSCIHRIPRCDPQCAAKHFRTAKLERVNDFVNNEKSNWWAAPSLFALSDCLWTTFLLSFILLFAESQQETRTMKLCLSENTVQLVQTTKRFEDEQYDAGFQWQDREEEKWQPHSCDVGFRADSTETDTRHLFHGRHLLGWMCKFGRFVCTQSTKEYAIMRKLNSRCIHFAYWSGNEQIQNVNARLCMEWIELFTWKLLLYVHNGH